MNTQKIWWPLPLLAKINSNKQEHIIIIIRTACGGRRREACNFHMHAWCRHKILNVLKIEQPLGAQPRRYHLHCACRYHFGRPLSGACCPRSAQLDHLPFVSPGQELSLLQHFSGEDRLRQWTFCTLTFKAAAAERLSDCNCSGEFGHVLGWRQLQHCWLFVLI